MIRYWEEDTETEIGRPFDLEKHDKEISDKWLDNVKQAREEIEKYKTRQLTLAIGVEDLGQGEQVALDCVMAILDKLIKSERANYENKQNPYKDFCEFVAKKVLRDDFEENVGANAEIFCRKLSKLGIIKADGDKWVLAESEEKMKSYQWWKRQKKRVQKKYTLLLGRYLSPKELREWYNHRVNR